MAYRNKERKTITTKSRQEIFKRDRYICGYCGKKKKSTSLVIDHIIPVRYGGFHGVKNFVTACRRCNRKKWLYGPKEKGAPKLIWCCGREVVKTTWLAKGKKFPKRIPKISYEKLIEK